MPKFVCYHCIYCCFFRDPIECPVLFPWEKRVIEDLLEDGETNTSFEPLEVWRDSKGVCIVTLYRWVIRGFCPFYDIVMRRCKIHEMKPLACQMFPLLVEVPSGKVMISSKCLWTKKNQKLLKELRRPEVIAHVFPSEFTAAVTVLQQYNSILEAVREEKLVRVNDFSSCKLFVDVDSYMVGDYGWRERRKEEGEEGDKTLL
ncbi:MAG TPA: YkgJ family cysteine cluster protein [Pyrodictium sp.]|nr:YkgJ family cysteine cluster protein [Pyrodictium sp.]